ncbi:MAG: hypothetical protein UZ14_CFX002002297 [Chloroflexi bacterium OLB14]|nr:MAG: hypothetical protein UZ14_CFX002002297 [Chloroflexi bacterium OLB14]
MTFSKKIIVKKLPKFEADLYANLSLADLVVFAMSYLEERGVEATTEEIVSISFRLFPHKFGMKQFPRWPDSALVIRRLNDAREKKFVKGNPNDGFALTFKGKQVAKRISKQLGIKKKAVAKKKKQKPVALVLSKKTLRRRYRKPIQKKAVKKPATKKVGHALSVTKTDKAKKSRLQTRPTKKVGHALSVTKKRGLPIRATKDSVKKKVEVQKQVEVRQEAVKVVKNEAVASVSKEEKIKAGRVIHQVERSDAFKLYKKNGKQAKISEFDFRNMLFATMESSSETLSRNVVLFKKYANIESRNDVVVFLNFCEEFFAKLLKKTK